MKRFDLKIIGGMSDLDLDNDNVDVEVRFSDGTRYAATFFTIANIENLFGKNRQTGECKSGLYLWASDMIIVKQLTNECIRGTIIGLQEDGEFESAFSKLED